MEELVLIFQIIKESGSLITALVVATMGLIISKKVESFKDQNARKSSFNAKWADQYYSEAIIFIGMLHEFIVFRHKLADLFNKDVVDKDIIADAAAQDKNNLIGVHMQYVKLKYLLALSKPEIKVSFDEKYKEFANIIGNSRKNGLDLEIIVENIVTPFVKILRDGHHSILEIR